MKEIPRWLMLAAAAFFLFVAYMQWRNYQNDPEGSRIAWIAIDSLIAGAWIGTYFEGRSK